MADPPFAFHASAPPGEWLNDPNALLFHDRQFRLFAQHRVDAPAFRKTGWARLSSDDLLRWTVDGVAIAPADDRWAYSGCIVAEDSDFEAIHTEHHAGLEAQVRRSSRDGGATWSPAQPLATLGPPARNRRDPFVFRDGAGWAMLLAEPCDWHDWRDMPPSRIRLYRSGDRVEWRDAGGFGSCVERGIMWEVPILARVDGHDVLFVSEVDRRDDRADCTVKGWVGRLTERGFVPDPRAPAEGQRLDCGPDFYALMVSSGDHWPYEHPLFVAWLSSWQTARTMGWPGVAGGPISLPRSLSIVSGDDGSPLIGVAPAADAVGQFTQVAEKRPRAGVLSFRPGLESTEIRIVSPAATVRIAIDRRAGTSTVTREAEAGLAWSRTTRSFATTDGDAMLFVDGMVAEFFIHARAVSLAIPGGNRQLDVEIAVDGRSYAGEWRTLPPAS